MRELTDMAKAILSTQVRKLVPPSLRFELREFFAWVQDQLDKICLWRWEIIKFPHRNDSPYETLYVGRKMRRDYAKALLGIDCNAVAPSDRVDASKPKVIVSEAPIPGAFKVPRALRIIIPLGRPLDEVTAGFDDKLRRVLRNQRADYRTQLARDETAIKRADLELLQPYANARHGSAASQIASDEVLRIAQNLGRLDLVISGDELVGCILGCEINHAKKRYWGLIRCGYPESVFSDAKRLREINAINFYLALEWAIENRFDYFDMGTCMGRPEDGLLQWKKRWGGLVDSMGGHGYFYVRVSDKVSAQFFWDSPLFALDHSNLVLHLGLPDGQSDENFSLRFREMNRGMGIGGITKIYLHYASHPSENLLAALQSHYAHLKSPPTVECIQSN